MRAARQGDVASAAALGELLVQMRQSRDAVPWLTLAASHDHAHATALLAAIYYTGDGADQDLILATSLMKKAAAEGSPEARANSTCHAVNAMTTTGARILPETSCLKRIPPAIRSTDWNGRALDRCNGGCATA